MTALSDLVFVAFKTFAVIGEVTIAHIKPKLERPQSKQTVDHALCAAPATVQCLCMPTLTPSTHHWPGSPASPSVYPASQPSHAHCRYILASLSHRQPCGINRLPNRTARHCVCVVRSLAVITPSVLSTVLSVCYLTGVQIETEIEQGLTSH